MSSRSIRSRSSLKGYVPSPAREPGWGWPSCWPASRAAIATSPVKPGTSTCAGQCNAGAPARVVARHAMVMCRGNGCCQAWRWVRCTASLAPSKTQRCPTSRSMAAALVKRAESGDPVAGAALDLFIDLYGAWVGNVALLLQPRGGLYVAAALAFICRRGYSLPVSWLRPPTRDACAAWSSVLRSSGYPASAGRAGRDCNRFFPDMIHNLEMYFKMAQIWSGTLTISKDQQARLYRYYTEPKMVTDLTRRTLALVLAGGEGSRLRTSPPGAPSRRYR